MLSNDMSELVNQIEENLGLVFINPRLPERFQKDKWADKIKRDTFKTFSRFFPNKVKFVVNNDTCVKTRDKDGKTAYIIRDEFLEGVKLLGAMDIDFQDTSPDNISIGQTAGYGYYIPNYGNLEDTYLSFMQLQGAADVASLYNNGIYLEFRYPNKIILSRAGNLDMDLNSFVIDLLVRHNDLSTISPTKMEIVEELAQADIAKWLWMNLRYVDNLETIFVNVDLKLGELEQEAGKRDSIMEELKNAYVSAANDNIPYIMTVSG